MTLPLRVEHQADADCGIGHGKHKIFLNHAGSDAWEFFEEGHNLITYDGINRLLACLASSGNNGFFGYIAVSTSAAAPDAANHTLPGEVYRKAIDGVVTNTSARSVTLIATLNFAEANGNVLTKYGFLSLLVGGVLWNETNHTGISKTNLLQVRYQYTYSLV